MDDSCYTLALLLEYDGSRFYGFQKQLSSVRTIQGEVEKHLSTFANCPINIITSGRTDTGVHATHQVISFTTTIYRPLHAWVRGVNALLDKDIVIRDAVYVDNKFNARFDAVSRTYHYYLYVNPIRTALMRDKVGWYHASLDIDLMIEAGQYLIGQHDFSSFRASNCQAKNPVRDMTHFAITTKNNLIRFEFSANAFLYHMVRNMVGALIYVGNGKLNVDGFSDLINARNRKLAPPTFMPDGLYLVNVKYQDPLFEQDVAGWLF
jgi:tRNA pseudouridine38-40 synthase